MYRAGGPGGDAAGGRDGVRGRHRRDERQRQLRARPASPPASSASPTSRSATAWSRCWRRSVRAGGGRFRGVRHSAAWDASDDHRQQRRWPRARTTMRQPEFRAGLARLDRARPVARRLGLPPPARRRHRPGPRDARRRTSSWATAAGRSATAPTPASGTRSSRRGRPAITELAALPQRHHEARRHDDAAGRLRLRGPAGAADLGRAGGALAAVHRDLHRAVRGRRAACSRATSPSRRWASATRALWNAFKRIAAGASADEKRALFSGTARRVYRLD